MKRAMAWVLSAVMLLSTLPVQAAAKGADVPEQGREAEERVKTEAAGKETAPASYGNRFGVCAPAGVNYRFHYQLDDTYEPPVASINDCWGTASTVTIPETVDGYRVVRIEANTFSGLGNSLHEVVFQIGDAYVHEDAFAGCNSVERIWLDDKMTSLYGLPLTASLREIHLGEGITDLSFHDFDACIRLETVTLGSAVMNIPGDLLDHSQWYRNQPDGPVYLDGYLMGWKGAMVQGESLQVRPGTRGIASGALHGRAELQAVTVPDSVTFLGSDAFAYCPQLTEIHLGASLTEIGQSAFQNCGWYAQQPEGMLYLDDCLLGYKGAVPANFDVRIADGTRVVGSGFYDQKNLRSVTIPDSVTALSKEAFQYCGTLDTLRIGSGVQEIHWPSFYGTEVREIWVGDGLTSLENLPLTPQLEALHMGRGIRRIDRLGLEDCTRLQQIDIGPNVTWIDGGAFENTAWYSQHPDGPIYLGDWLLGYHGTGPIDNPLYIKEGTRHIADRAMNGCTDLRNIVFPETLETIGRAFEECVNLEAVRLPDSVTSLSSGAFDWDEALREIYLGDGLTELEEVSFSTGFPNLEKLHIGDGIKKIPRGCFRSCENLRELYIGSSVTSIENSFSGNRLTSVTIPDSVRVLGEYTFLNCRLLSEIHMSSQIEYIGGSAFEDTLWEKRSPEGMLYLGTAAISYHGTVPENGVVELRPDTTVIAGDAFYGQEHLQAVTIPAGVRGIGDRAFSDCRSLRQAALPSGLNRLGENAFDGCAALEELTLPSSIESIPRRCFWGCTALRSVVIPESVTNIGYEAFARCSGLREITIPDSVTQMREHTFSDCTSLQKLWIGDGLWKIPASAFYGCSALKQVHIGDKVQVADSGAFAQCSNVRDLYVGRQMGAWENLPGTEQLRTLTVPGTIQYLEQNFAGDSLREVVISRGLGRIMDYSRDSYQYTPWYQRQLDSLTLSEGITSIGERAFCESGLDHITIPASVREIHPRAFELSEGLQTIRFQGDAPQIAADSFTLVQAKAAYEASNPTWTSERRQDYGGKLDWQGVSGETLYLPAPQISITQNETTGRPALTWPAVKGAECYVVYRMGSGENTFTKVLTTEKTALQDITALQGETYTYRVAASAQGVESPCSLRAEGTCVCAKPVVDITVGQDRKPLLTWAPVEGAETYVVQYEITVDGQTYSGDYTVEETSFSHRQALEGTECTYRVVANGANGGYSAPSDAVSILCPRRELEAAADPDTGKPVLRWDAVPNAFRYQVEYAKDGDAFVPLSEPTSSALEHSEAVPGVYYRYRVRPVISLDDNLPWSETAEAVCCCARPVVTVTLNEQGKPILTWPAVPEAVGYTVLGAISGGSYEVLGMVQYGTFEHSVAQVGNTYSYQVVANGKNPAGNSAPSVPVSILVTEEISLAAPVLTITNKASTGKPYLTWNAVDGAVKYEVCRATGKNGPFDHLWSGSGRSLTNGKAVAGTTYYYRVRALTNDGTASDWSAVVTRTCDLPQPQLTVDTRSDGKPVLTWNAVDGAAGYAVSCSVDGGAMNTLKGKVSGTRLTHGSAQYGHTYTYKVRALAGKSAANSAWSTAGTITVEAPVQNFPAPVLKASNKRTTGKPYLTWNAVDGAAKYEVYRATAKSGQYTHLWDGSGTTLTNGSAKPGTTYYYKVRAITADGTKGPWSQICTRTCDCAQPDVKLTVRSDGKPVLSWQKITGAVKYEVYRSDNGATFTRLATVKGTKLTNSSAKPGHTYRYKVRAIAEKSAANSSWSYYDTVTIQ